MTHEMKVHLTKLKLRSAELANDIAQTELAMEHYSQYETAIEGDDRLFRKELQATKILKHIVDLRIALHKDV